LNFDPIVEAVREGRAEQPTPWKILISNPAPRCLRLELSLKAEETVDTVKDRIRRYLEAAGYKALSESQYGRGSRVSGMFSLSPRGIRVSVSTVLESMSEELTAVRACFDIDLTGQTVIGSEKIFWETEVSGLGDAILGGEIDANAAAANANRARKGALVWIAVFLGGCVALSLLRILLDWLFVEWLPANFGWWEKFANSEPAAIGVIVAILIALAVVGVGRRLRRR